MRSFVKQVLATLTGLILFGALGVGGLFFLVAALSWGAREPEASIEDDTILTLDLSQGITDANVDMPVQITGLLSGNTPSRPLSLRVALDAIAAAADDDRITALYLEGNLAGGAGFATLREIRLALEQFQSAGKPIYAYNRIWSERDYYLASVADHLYLNPNGLVELNGLSTETTFFAGALEKYGVEVQVLRAGQYKSAVEPFIRQESSPQEIQQTEAWLTDLWQGFVTATATSRELSPQAIQAIADTQALVLAQNALEDGLVDALRQPDEVLDELLAVANVEDPKDLNQVSVTAYDTATSPGKTAQTSRNQVALVYIEGDIVGSTSSPTQVGGDRTVQLLQELRRDDNIKAVVLRINSPGGSATASDDVAREVQLLRDTKPTIASMGNVAASGGYQIATFAQRIYASPNTITGSIGVFSLLPNVQELANTNGITWDGVKTARYADTDTLARSKTPAELAIQQQVVDQLYSNFLQTVADSRSLPLAEVEAVAQGRVWSGEDAQSVGLVDELGGLNEAIAAAVTAAELDDDWQLVEYPRAQFLGQFSFASQLRSLAFSPLPLSHSPDPLTQTWQQVQTDLQSLRALDDPMGLYMRMPINPVVR